MKKKPVITKRPSPVRRKSEGLAPLIAEVRNLIRSARRGVSSAVNTFQVRTNFEIGRRIVEHEQQGAKRAGYGDTVLRGLAEALTAEFGRGFSETNLKLMRQFYLVYQQRICQKPSDELAARSKGQTPSDESLSIRPTTISANCPKFPSLSWSHYVQLLSIRDADERSFYEIEATSEGWSVPELKRQKASCLYERLALSRDKKSVKRLASEGQLIARPEDLLKEPFVLEFIGLNEHASYSESDLEAALIDHLEKFLLELGKGFLFEARQKRLTFDGDPSSILYFTTDCCAATS